MHTRKTTSRRISTTCFAISLIVALLPRPAIADGGGGGEVIRGPYTISVRGGGQSNSAAGGVDGRADYLFPLLNVHLFGMYDRLDDGRGIGLADNKRYGGGLALSHTFARTANVFAGYAFLNEVGESFAHAYLGGKFKLGAHLLANAAYGFGLGGEKRILNGPAVVAQGESVNWAKAGVTYVGGNGWKAYVRYRLSDPSGHSISGTEGGFSYPLTPAFTIGVNGDYDITDRDNVDRNWRGLLFVAYSFGGQKGVPIEVALDKNDPIIYPVVLRSAPSSSLTISPVNATVQGCSGGSQIFTASGGVPPYTWSSSTALGNFIPDFGGDNTKSFWDDSSDDFCNQGGALQITVTDSAGATASSSVTVLGGT